MINVDHVVPENTLAIISNSKEKINYSDIIFKPGKKRSWFVPDFYRCLPLTVANTYGFLIASDFDFSVTWTGGDTPEDIIIERDNEVLIPKTGGNPFLNNKIKVTSHFGLGMFTIGLPFILKTPPGINLLTMNPPNYINPNLSVLSAAVETDNLRHNFTINVRMQIPNITVKYEKGAPLAALLPIPRHFANNFSLVMADDIFDDEIVEEERIASRDFAKFRKEIEPTLKNHVNRQYFIGKDVYGNEFEDHERP